MKRLNYLEFILTINAILLSGVLWINLTDSPVTTPAPANAQNTPHGTLDAGAQRVEMINAIRNVSASVKALRSDLKNMEFKVRVTSMPAGLKTAEKRSSARAAQQDPPTIKVTRVPASKTAADDSK